MTDIWQFILEYIEGTKQDNDIRLKSLTSVVEVMKEEVQAMKTELINVKEQVHALNLEKCYMQLYIDSLHDKNEYEDFKLPRRDQLSNFFSSPIMEEECPPPAKIRRGKRRVQEEMYEECPTPAPVRRSNPFVS